MDVAVEPAQDLAKIAVMIVADVTEMVDLVVRLHALVPPRDEQFVHLVQRARTDACGG